MKRRDTFLVTKWIMKNVHLTLVLIVLSVSGCKDTNASENKAVREEADSKARAEAAKKEMKVLPETFKARYNRKLDQAEPNKTAPEVPAEKKSP